MPEDRVAFHVSRQAAVVARALLEAGAVTLTPDAPVTFKSGLRSPVYVDNRRLISQPRPWHTVIEAFEAELLEGALLEGELLEGAASDARDDLVIAGVESAGIPHSSALAFATGRPSVFVRKAAKEHGLGRRVEGGEVAGRSVVLVEDMVTTGGSSLAAVEALREAGASVSGCLAIITYGFGEAVAAFADAGVQLRVLTTFEDVIREALAARRIGESSAALVRSWLADPHDWRPE
jgi:orotate phosphoribosyltransferase